VVGKVRVAAFPKEEMTLRILSNSQMFSSNNRIFLLVVRKHLPKKKLLLMILILYNLANDRAQQAYRKKKTSNSPRQVRHQRRSRKVLQTSRKTR
jgi:hypothetical protein